MTSALLGPGDPPPFVVHRPGGASRFVFIGDHAGQAVPLALAKLGLPQSELDRHIGWDIGVAGVAAALAAQLDAVTILQRYSRLVIDCNRPLHAPDSIATVSDGTLVPGNQSLSEAARRARTAEIFGPYHQRIVQELDARAQVRPILVTLHSFTPVFRGHARPWHAGVLYQRDARLAHALRDALAREPGLVVGDNEPYAASDATDYAVPVYGEGRGLLHVELELRQDLIEDEDGQRAWAARFARLLEHCVASGRLG
ncbi:MAG: N-formylglutamate amidohydrolase [Myxococcales bacterium]|nr:N-formylglutamate amidohydrolase [Myxococcales bacterium]MCB9628415.1 N-formylglutamate amidohydrolase [Sandaracinaceae bacterium]